MPIDRLFGAKVPYPSLISGLFYISLERRHALLSSHKFYHPLEGELVEAPKGFDRKSQEMTQSPFI